MKRTFTCIVCPNSCEITAEYEGSTIHRITGATCAKGEDYVRQELTDPKRTIATSVPVIGGELPLVSVRLDAPIPKAEIFRVMAEINRHTLTAPTVIGQVLIKNVCGLGSNVIVTKNVPVKEVSAYER